MFIVPFAIGLAVQWVYPLAGPPRWTRILLGVLCALPAIALYAAAQITLLDAMGRIGSFYGSCPY